MDCYTKRRIAAGISAEPSFNSSSILIDRQSSRYILLAVNDLLVTFTRLKGSEGEEEMSEIIVSLTD